MGLLLGDMSLHAYLKPHKNHISLHKITWCVCSTKIDQITLQKINSCIHPHYLNIQNNPHYLPIEIESKGGLNSH